MRYTCPRCGHEELKLTDKTCPNCKLVLSIRPLLKFYWHQWKKRLKRAAVTRCPHCNENVPLNAAACVCGESLKVGDAVAAALDPSRKKLEHFVNTAGTGTQRLIQWLYLAVSLTAGCWLLNYVHAQYSKQWIGYAALSTVYLGVLVVLANWLVPQQVFKAVKCRGAPVKLALLANFLSLLLLLQLVIKAWWAQALALAALIGVAVLGLLLSNFITSIQAGKSRPGDSIHTKTRPQGRKAVID
jgi:hypothetical protein